MEPHLRKDIISSNWVIVSDERASRPNDYTTSNKCPFCRGNEENTPPEIMRVEKNNRWIIRVVPNKYPALVYNTKNIIETEGIYQKYYYSGVHEVIIESDEHNKIIYEIEHFDKVLEIFALRMREILKKDNVKYVMLFRNYGVNAGASLRHPHSQIIGLPLLPVRITDEMSHFKRYRSKHGRCAFCDMIEEEKRYKKRVISKNKDFIAFAPFASRFNFEIWLAPLRHNPHFYLEKNFKSLKNILFDVCHMIHNTIKNPSYNIIIHTSPCSANDFHWHIEILPKIAMPAGFEWGSGFYINTVSPEEAAFLLRSGKKASKISDVGCQKTDVRGQKSEGRGQSLPAEATSA
ncbi:MAG: DUF4931 domain-containing protein [Elusimicrobiales bacterium]|nr:DUF4931 domain-containing protein [Elusimicrobiales bacterium]